MLFFVTVGAYGQFVSFGNAKVQDRLIYDNGGITTVDKEKVLHNLEFKPDNNELFLAGESQALWGAAVRFLAKTVAGWIISKQLDRIYESDTVQNVISRARELLQEELGLANKHLPSIEQSQVVEELVRLSEHIDALESLVEGTRKSQEQLKAYVEHLYKFELLPLKEKMEAIEIRVTQLEVDLARLDGQVRSNTTQIKSNTKRVGDIEKDLYTNLSIVPEGGAYVDFTNFKTSYLDRVFNFVPFDIDSTQVIVGLGVSLGFKINELFLINARGSLYLPQEKSSSVRSETAGGIADTLNVLEYEGFNLSLGASLNLFSQSGFSATIGGGYSYHQFSVGYGVKPVGIEGRGDISERKDVQVNFPYVSAGVRVVSEGFIIYGLADALLPAFEYKGVHFVVGIAVSLGRK